MKKVAIKSSSLPTRSPVLFAIVMWLLADRLGAPDWAYGVLWTVVALLAILFVYGQLNTTFRDVPGFGEK
jgi:hypothetical protein